MTPGLGFEKLTRVDIFFTYFFYFHNSKMFFLKKMDFDIFFVFFLSCYPNLIIWIVNLTDWLNPYYQGYRVVTLIRV
jgi:hypothetical protein